MKDKVNNKFRKNVMLLHYIKDVLKLFLMLIQEKKDLNNFHKENKDM